MIKMWTEIATSGAIVGLVGALFRHLEGRVKKLENTCVDDARCKERLDRVAHEFSRGEKEFNEIQAKLSKIDNTVARMDGRLEHIYKKNGGDHDR